MRRLACASLALLSAAGLSAQSNVVPGLDGRLTEIDDLTYYGRRGPSYPNGEIGMAMLNTMCNPGSVTIPWYQAMQPDHPKFGFLIVRVANDRIEQINEWSFCKHAFVSVNVNGACGSCQDPGTGSLMGLNCSDTYGSGNNADRYWLGPPEEIDPWLGTWNPVGSYFDIGDPNQAGYPAPADGSRSLNSNIFDNVQNRVTVDEIDLTTPNARYYYGLQLIHQGEAVQNRGDNLAHRGFNASNNGNNWSFSNNTEGQEHGTILDRWPGASVEVGQNGNDDGRFFVAVKVTPLGGGNYHYEYAIHNVDNSRAGAGLRIPIDASATASNFSFRDIDKDQNNDWTVQRVGNEIVFAAQASSRPLEWNTIYNFGFDADFPPGTSYCEIDEARPGPGALEVQVQTLIPGGSTIANYELYGAGCPGSTQLPEPPCAELNGSATTPVVGTVTSDQWVYRCYTGSAQQVEAFDIRTRSTTGGPVTVQAYLFDTAATIPNPTPIATTTMTVGANLDYYRATFSPPVTVGAAFYIGFDNMGGDVILSEAPGGTPTLCYSRTSAQSAWTIAIGRPAYRVDCQIASVFPSPELAISGAPELGTTVDITLDDALPQSVAWLVASFTRTNYQGLPLPYQMPGVPGCELLVGPEMIIQRPVSSAGTGSFGLAIPNNNALVGVNAYYQWAVYDPTANSYGFVLSNAVGLTLGN